MPPKQLSFLPVLNREYGGALVPGRRKGARPISTRDAMHIVLRSTRARGDWSMLKPQLRPHIDAAAQRIAQRHGVRLYRYANVGNHLHLLVKTPTRGAFQRFLKDLAGSIAIIVTGAKNSQPLTEGRFWDQLAYTRIVSWGRDFKNLEVYFIKNLFEAAGLLTKKAKALGLKVIPIAGWTRNP